MGPSWRKQGKWLATGVVLALVGALLIARAGMDRVRDAFETDARIMHRLLSQRVVQHDAVLATLALLQPAGTAEAPAEQRLSSVYPQILGVRRREGSDRWSNDALAAAEAQSRSARRAALAGVELEKGHYEMVLAAEPASFALSIDLRTTVPWSEWPTDPATSPTRVTLDHAGQSFVLQPGRPGFPWLGFEFHKALAADSQPFVVTAVRQVSWGDFPWLAMAAWTLAVAAALAGAQALLRQRAERHRAEELLRLGQVARLNTMGELAAGMAHELNQPLTALLASTQAAEQARRAADVVGRLRRAVERPDPAAALGPVVLQGAVQNALYLLEPECRRRGVAPTVQAPATPVTVLADPVALEQVIHNLLLNALQALDAQPAGERQLQLDIASDSGQGVLRVADSGPGIADDVLPRLFEPFFSTRDGGLGLGLSLCETLVTGMGGQLRVETAQPHGAVFVLTLALADGGATPP